MVPDGPRADAGRAVAAASLVVNRPPLSLRLERIQHPCIAGSGAAKVSSRGEDTPNARREIADPRAHPFLDCLIVATVNPDAF